MKYFDGEDSVSETILLLKAVTYLQAGFKTVIGILHPHHLRSHNKRVCVSCFGETQDKNEKK